MERQTPIRGLFFGVIGLIALILGSALVAQTHESHLGGVLNLLLLRYQGASLACSAAAWGGALAGLFSVVAFYAAFAAEDDPYDRRGFPKGMPILFFLLSLALLWGAFLCARVTIGERAEPPPARRAVEAAAPVAKPKPAVRSEPSGDLPPSQESQSAPLAQPDRAPPPPPEVVAKELPLTWIYAEPLIFNGDWSASDEAQEQLEALFPVSGSNGETRALLCGKAWIGLAGAASQEGERDKNEKRARLRAQLAAEAAARWLRAQDDDCARPLLLGLDLGQHEETVSDPDPSETAFQRQILIVSRVLEHREEVVSEDKAIREIMDYYASPEGRAALLGGRRYTRDPLVFTAVDPR